MTRSCRGLIAFIAILTIILLQTEPVESYEKYRLDQGASCSDCHPGFLDRGPLHDLHQGSNQMTNECGLCHISPGDIPFTYTSGDPNGEGCRGCHGRDNGTSLRWGAGLRLHHANAGVPADSDGLFCVDCHFNDPTPLPEDTLPVYYGRPDVNISDPCATMVPGGEDWDGDGEGHDNDGDLDYESDDSDCGPTDVPIASPARPGGVVLLSIAPNPAELGPTRVEYRIETRSDVSIGVYDAQGRLVYEKTELDRSRGVHTFVFAGRDRNGRPLAAGVYFVRIFAHRASATGRVVWVR